MTNAPWHIQYLLVLKTTEWKGSFSSQVAPPPGHLFFRDLEHSVSSYRMWPGELGCVSDEYWAVVLFHVLMNMLNFLFLAYRTMAGMRFYLFCSKMELRQETAF